jgi:hypothetical protein
LRYVFKPLKIKTKYKNPSHVGLEIKTKNKNPTYLALFLFFRKPVDYQSASQKYAEREEKPTSTSMQSKSFKFLKDTLDSGQGNICLHRFLKN